MNGTVNHALSTAAPVLVALAVVGCGATDAGHRSVGSTVGSQRISPSSAVTEPAPQLNRTCRGLASAKTVVVLCPQTLLSSRTPSALQPRVAHADLETSTGSYLTDVKLPGRQPNEVFHMMFGGRKGPFSLATLRGRWPVTLPIDDLRLIGYAPLRPGQTTFRRVKPEVLGHLRVAGEPALLLREDAYPQGGVQGGHYVIVWNRSGNGYEISMHYLQPPALKNVSVLLVAEAMSMRAA